MMARPIILTLLICLPLAGQVPPTPPVPPVPSVPMPHGINGRYVTVITHQLEISPLATLIMKDLRGDVDLQGTGTNQIVIEETIRVRASSASIAQELIQDLMGELQPGFGDNTYTFKVGKPTRRNVYYGYKVAVPRISNVMLHSYGGDIDLADLQGDLEVKNGGGDIDLYDIAGKIRIHTGGGDIDARKIEGRVTLFSGGGDIQVRTVEGQFTVKTGGGDIDCSDGTGSFTFQTGGGDIDLLRLEGPQLEARTGGGDITVRAIIAKVNLLTGGGDISVEELTGELEAATGGGDLDLRQIRGDMVVSTGAGDVDIRHTTGSVRVNSGHGDISIIGMSLDEPGQEESTITTGSGDVYVNVSNENPVDITARIKGYAPRWGSKRIHSNRDLDFHGENNQTIGVLETEHPFHRIILETGDGEILIIFGED